MIRRLFLLAFLCGCGDEPRVSEPVDARAPDAPKPPMEAGPPPCSVVAQDYTDPARPRCVVDASSRMTECVPQLGAKKQGEPCTIDDCDRGLFCTSIGRAPGDADDAPARGAPPPARSEGGSEQASWTFKPPV